MDIDIFIPSRLANTEASRFLDMIMEATNQGSPYLGFLHTWETLDIWGNLFFCKVTKRKKNEHADED